MSSLWGTIDPNTAWSLHRVGRRNLSGKNLQQWILGVFVNLLNLRVFRWTEIRLLCHFSEPLVKMFYLDFHMITIIQKSSKLNRKFLDLLKNSPTQPTVRILGTQLKTHRLLVTSTDSTSVVYVRSTTRHCGVPEMVAVLVSKLRGIRRLQLVVRGYYGHLFRRYLKSKSLVNATEGVRILFCTIPFI